MRTLPWERPRWVARTGVPADHFPKASRMMTFGCQCGGTCASCTDAAHFGATGGSVSDKDWAGSASRFTDEQYERAAAACDSGDGTVKDRCHLPHHEPDGTINRKGVRAAAGRIGSTDFAETATKDKAAAHLRSHYSKDLNEDPPDSIKTSSASADGFSHGAQSGSHSHSHAAYGSQGGDANHEHSHTHDGDASHDHDHASHDHDHAGITPAGPGLTADASGLPKRWHAYGFVEGLRTTDGRAAAVDAGIFRDTPMPLAFQQSNEPGHFGSVVVGTIESLSRQERDGYALIYAEGSFDLGSEDGQEAARQVAAQGGNRFVSADIEPIESDWVSTGEGGMGDDLLDMLFGDTDGYELLTKYRFAGLTIVSIPAFPQCVIAPADVALPEVAPMGALEDRAPGPMLVASITPPERPPAAWFEDPRLSRPTPITVTDEGRVYGHIAAWSTCHTGNPQGPNICTTAPRSPSGYGYFRTGELETAEGPKVSVGQLTMGAGHADSHADWRAAAAHYDGGPGAVQVADVACGEDAHGIWFAGALRPGVTPEQVREFRACNLSGDWRRIRGEYELVAVAAGIPVPGFPIPRLSIAASALTADQVFMDMRPKVGLSYGEPVSLVAAGVVRHDPYRDAILALAEKVAAIEAAVGPLMPSVLDGLAASMEPVA